MNCLRRNCIPIVRCSRIYTQRLNDLPHWRVTGVGVSNRLNTGNRFSFDSKIIQYNCNSRLRLGVSNYVGGLLNSSRGRYDLRHLSVLSVQSLAPSNLLLQPLASVRLYCAKTYSKDNKIDREEEVKYPEPAEEEELKKLTLFQKFKQMYRDYWYVLIPVHCATSVFWFGGFYLAAKSGVDIVSILEFLNVSESLIEPFRNGHGTAKHAGLLAVTFALYKIATPLRYATTLFGTTFAINHLKRLGYIKPMPRKEQLKEMYQERKDIILEKIKEKQQMKDSVLQHFKDAQNRKKSDKKP